MNKIICQKDEICSGCGCELPRGSWAYEDKYDDLLCEDCCFEKIENNCGFYPDTVKQFISSIRKADE